MKKYFHELDESDFSDLLELDIGWDYIMSNYLQPSWCSYPNALSFQFGCWRLTDLSEGRSGISCEHDCINCDCYKRKE